MADAAISFLINNVGKLLMQEASKLVGVEDQVKSLHDELNLIKEFLGDSEGNRDKVKELMSQIQAVAYRAEDVIDTYVVSMAKHGRRNTLKKFLHTRDRAVMLRGVATDIERINNDIRRIYANKDTGYVEEDEVVGFTHDAEKVMELLRQGGRHRDVVSIIGMGGLGKTTLAKKIYNHSSMRKRFKCFAWVSVSEEFRSRELLLGILRCVTPAAQVLYQLSDDKLEEELRKCLVHKKYLIVLDDVWTTKVWDEIKAAFPDNLNGSRILITSRVKEVGLHASSSRPYFLPFLSDDDSWELFSKKVFRGEVCPPHLKENGEQIAKKCRGLPLAIVVAAGLLAARDQNTATWNEMATNFSWYLSRDPERCLDILALSYEDLPAYLKPCFLYFGVFPEDFEIPVRPLIRLWIAEGLVENDNNREMEDIAEDYFDQLIDRSLIQVVRRRTDGVVKVCRIHDLLRDLCISEGRRERFLEAHQREVSTTSFSSTTTLFRRLSIHCNTSTYIPSIPSGSNSSQVRSLLCFGTSPGDRLSMETFKLLYERFRLLRVLDLGSTLVHNVSPQVRQLILLRYLRMNAPYLKEIPSFMTELPNLQTLDLRKSPVVSLTNDFWKMQQLRHLFLSRCGEVLQGRGTVMPNLQTLSFVHVSVASFSPSRGTTLFPNVKKLAVYGGNLYGCNKLERLRTLKIVGNIYKAIQPKILPSCLTKLTLRNTRLRQDSVDTLGRLPNLLILKLFDDSLSTYDGILVFGKRSFLQLQVLHFVELGFSLSGWCVESGALQSLQNLLFRGCRQLSSIPDELKHVTTLRHVKTMWCSDTLAEDISRKLGKDVDFSIS
ncbi:hypothetical protein RJ640_000248 [Escallonia rubra]|uniref:Disease resistance RPP13-like protein 3 n=1 Tax=Escallonia rubra TaxID=112253 RepID=A0AA88UPP4_9ASTE|nr:hypothetical protein RJ640_000248 [Escallonia rubra]